MIQDTTTVNQSRGRPRRLVAIATALLLAGFGLLTGTRRRRATP